MCICLYVSQSLQVVCASGAQGDQGVRSPEIQFTDTYELPRECWEPNLGPLQTQQVILLMSHLSRIFLISF